MQIKVLTKYLKISSKKMTPIARLIIGREIKEAINQLTVTNKKGARLLLKSLKSGLSNAQHDFNLQPDDLFVKEVLVNQGPSLKRWRARAQGKAAPILKRSLHLRIILETKHKIEPKEKAKPEEKPAKIEKLEKRGAEIKVPSKKEPVKPKEAEASKRVFDKRRVAADRHKQHLDKIKMKEKGGFLKRIFRRKTD